MPRDIRDRLADTCIAIGGLLVVLAAAGVIALRMFEPLP